MIGFQQTVLIYFYRFETGKNKLLVFLTTLFSCINKHQENFNILFIINESLFLTQKSCILTKRQKFKLFKLEGESMK